MKDTGMTSRTGERHCSVARTLEIVGDPWSYLVLREIFLRLRRFDEIQSSLGVARNILSARLDHLVSRGVLVRRLYHERPPRFEYRLTEMGRDLYPSLIAMIHWGDTWLAGDAGPPLHLPDSCGHGFHGELTCSVCGDPMGAHDVRYADGPGAGAAARPEGRRARRTSNPEAYERGRACSVARTLKILGDPWTFLVLREAFFSVRRFDEIQARLDIARNILADRLSILVRNGVLERRPYQSRPKRLEYRLTDKGRGLYPSIAAMIAWGDRWLADETGPPLALRHKGCGEVFTPVIACSACGQAVSAREVTWSDGPGARGTGVTRTDRLDPRAEDRRVRPRGR